MRVAIRTRVPDVEPFYETTDPMKTEKIMNEAKRAVERRSAALAIKILQSANEGAAAEQISAQIAQHIINMEWPAAAGLFIDMEAVEAKG